jgi:uncharacterized short protein YbdD (DUF466 family)
MRRVSGIGAALRAGAATLWRALRAASGDDAYERYCAHHDAHHASEPLMSRHAFCAEALRRRWDGVSRCC